MTQQLDVQHAKITFIETHEVQELCLNASARTNCTFRLLYKESGSGGRAMSSSVLGCNASDAEIKRGLEEFKAFFPALSVSEAVARRSEGSPPDTKYDRCRNVTFSAGASSAGNIRSLGIESNETASAPIVNTLIHGADGVGGSFRVRVTYGCEEEAGGCRQSAWSSPIPADASGATFDAAMSVLTDVGGTRSTTRPGNNQGDVGPLKIAQTWNFTFVLKFGNLSVVEIDDAMLSVSGSISDSSLEVAALSRARAKISATAFKIADGRIQGRPLTGCTTCEVGKSARLKGSPTCTQCPKGTFAGTRGQDLCTACPKGKYGDVRGLVRCKACAPGMFAPGEVRGETPEAEEWHMRRGNVLCFYCQVGRATAVENTAECPHCAPGKHATEPGMTRCVDCEPGKYAPSGLEDCLRCAPGRYANSSGWPQCKVCERGKASMLEGRKKCSLCGAGRYTDVIERPLPYSCEQCPVGRSAAVLGTERCSACSTGTYASARGARECFKCAANAVQGSDRSSCVCVDGFRTYAKDGPCFKCERGAFCEQCQGVYDRFGKCCGGVLDADERCCGADSVVDSCGVCDGNHSSCKARFTVRLNVTFGDVPGRALGLGSESGRDWGLELADPTTEQQRGQGRGRDLADTTIEQQHGERRINISLVIARQVSTALQLPATRVDIEDTFEDRSNIGIIIGVLPLNRSRDLPWLTVTSAGNATLSANASNTLSPPVNASNTSAVVANSTVEDPSSLPSSRLNETSSTGNSSIASSIIARGDDPHSTRMDRIAEKLRVMLADPTSEIFTGMGDQDDNSSNWTSVIIHDDGFTLKLVGVCGNGICEVGEGPKKCPQDCEARQKFRPSVKVGFWQRDSDVFPCPDPSACVGASQCSNQTHGVMCARCAFGHTFDYFARCTECSGPVGIFVLFILLVTLLVLLVVTPIHLFVQPVLKASDKDRRRLSSYEIKQVTPLSVGDDALAVTSSKAASDSFAKVEKARLERTSVGELQEAIRVSAVEVL